MRTLVISGFAILLAFVAPAGAEDKGKSSPTKKVLVELYTSQGCDSCPPASDLLGRLAELDFGPDRVVAVGFHVDYFNDPWVDPYSDAGFSRRQLAYNEVQKRNDLYFTPLMMVDGTYPMLGSDRSKAVTSLAKALKEPVAVSLGIALERAGAGKTLSVEVTARSADVTRRDLLICVALTEDPVATRVLSGENGGKTLIEHAVVRSFDYKTTRVTQTEPKTLTFPLQLATGQSSTRSRVAVFVQDRLNGKVYQVEASPWELKAGPTSNR